MTRTVVLLHGFTHTGASWDRVIASLGERYRALAPDLRGHGAASEREPVGLDAVIGDVEHLTPGPLILGGYSMGGRIALHVALELADRVRHLVLVGASPGIRDPAERETRRLADEQLAAEIEGSSIEQFARVWAQTPVLADQPAAVSALARDERLRNTPRGLAAALRGLGTGALPSLWERLCELRMPVTIVAGERDQKFRTIATDMAAAVHNAEVVVVPGAGHAVHLEAPERVAAVIIGAASSHAV